MRRVLRATLVVLIGIALGREASAQALGTIAGNAKDPSGAALPGVTVEVSSPALIEKVRTATTDGAGLYRIINLPPGTYVVTFTLSGFNTSRREGVEVSPGFTAAIDGAMRLGNIQETVTVTGESPVVDIQSAAQRRAVTDTQFKELPSGGSWIQMAALTSAVRRRTRTSAAFSATRLARKSPRTAAATATASRWLMACASATCISART